MVVNHLVDIQPIEARSVKLLPMAVDNSLEMSNYFYETGLFKNTDPGFIFDFTPSSVCVNDSYFLSHQWNMEAINACDAWTVSNGSQNIKIATQEDSMYNHTYFN